MDAKSTAEDIREHMHKIVVEGYSNNLLCFCPSDGHLQLIDIHDSLPEKDSRILDDLLGNSAINYR